MFLYNSDNLSAAPANVRKGRGECYYANLKESSLAWKIMLVLSRIEFTPSILKAPNLTRQISILLFSSAKKILHTFINNKKKKNKLNQTFSPVWVTFHAALKVEMCLLNWNDYRFFPPMAKTIIVTRNTGSKGKEKLSDRGCLVFTWQNTYQLAKLGLICE